MSVKRPERFRHRHRPIRRLAPAALTAVSQAPSLTTPARPRQRWMSLVFLLGQMAIDAIMLALTYEAAYRLRLTYDLFSPFREPTLAENQVLRALLITCILIVFNLSGLYRLKRGASRIDEFYKICSAVSIGTVVTIALMSLVLADRINQRQLIITFWLLGIPLVMLGRLIFFLLVATLRRLGIDRERLLIVGTGETSRIILDTIERSPHLGYQVVGFVSNDDQNEVKGVPVLGTIDRLAEVVRLSRADEVIIALSNLPQQELLELVDTCNEEPVSIKFYPDTFQLVTNNELSIGDLNGLPLVSVRNVTLRGFNRSIKRSFDVVFSALVLIICSPLMLLLALLVKLESPGPVFYTQERVGLDGKPFLTLKFRSMAQDAEAKSGPIWSTPGDPRSTRIGRFMRRHSLDELPQFINVLIGEMSVVGPRPERPHFVEQFAQTIPRYMRRHIEKAGITGWAQVNGLRGDTSIQERTRYDLYYVENWSLLFDLKIIVKTTLLLFGDRYAH